MEWETLATSGLIGAAGGLISAFSGYLRNVGKENFEWRKALNTCCLGAAVGLFAALQPFFPASNLDVLAGSSILTTMGENAAKGQKKEVKNGSKKK